MILVYNVLLHITEFYAIKKKQKKTKQNELKK